MKKLNISRGAASSIILVLGIALLLVVVVVFVVIKVNASKTADGSLDKNSEAISTGPVYDTNAGDVRFLVVSATDLGNVLHIQNPRNMLGLQDTRYDEPITTTEKFIKVVIGAQNKGKLNIPKDIWEVENIVDSDGRNFVPIDAEGYVGLPDPDLCGSLIKPEFEPTPCVKIYEVSKASTGLKVKVKVNISVGIFPKAEESFLDLTVQ